MQTAPNSEILLRVLGQLLGELHPEGSARREINLDSRLDRDLGLDSLARIELLARLEKEFAVRLPEKALTSAETPRDVLRHLFSAIGEDEDATLQKHTSFAPSVQPEVDARSARTLIDVLEHHAHDHPDTGHILVLQAEDEHIISYGQLRERAGQVASLLQSLQLERGDTVALMLPTGADYFFSFFGALYAGCVPVPLYPPARPSQIEEHLHRHRKILGNAAAKILITVPEVKGAARLLQSQVPLLEKVLTVDELYLHVTKVSAPAGIQANSTAFLQYTSGSTGDPKGVILSHANLLANIRAMGQVCRVSASDVFVSWLPLYHDMGLIGAWLGSLYYGCRLVVMPPLSFIARPERWLRAIDRYRGTLSASPNFGYELCCSRLDDKDLAGLDLSSWRIACNGAEAVSPVTLRRFEERFGRYGYRSSATTPVYGLAESSVGLTFPPVDRGARIDGIGRDRFLRTGEAASNIAPEEKVQHFVSCGRPLPGHQVRIVDEQDRELPERREGRLQFKGPSATSGYYRNQQQTKAMFHGSWLDSGDLAYIAEGEIYVTSRVKDIIIRAGRNVYPHELEEIIGDIPGIRKGCTAVFGCKEPKTGAEQLIILAESRKKDREDLEKLRQQVNAVVIDYLDMAADDVVIAPPGSVLKTSSGKIRRAACRHLYETGRIGRKKNAVWLQFLRMVLASVVPLASRVARRITVSLYAGYCWLILILTAGLFWLPIVLSPGKQLPWRIARSGARVLIRLTGIRVTARGLVTFPAEGRFLLVSNHMSYLDSIVLAGILPRRCTFVAKVELKRNPALRIILKRLGTAFVARFDVAQSLDDIREIAENIHHGEIPLFFAEGTLQRTPGLLPFQMGAFVLAIQQQLPVVPITIRGTRNILRADSWFPRKGNVEIIIGEICQPKGGGWQAAIDLRRLVREKILGNLGEPDLADEYTSLEQLTVARPVEDA